MLYILGIKHFYQNTFNKDFDKYLRSLIRKFPINSLAEEYSIDACKLYCENGKSQLHLLSIELGLPHLYCDPTFEERKLLGILSDEDIYQKLNLAGKRCLNSSEAELVNIESRKDWGKREREWLKRLKVSRMLSKNTLLLIGFDHKKTLTKLIKSKGITYKMFKTRRFK